MRTAAALALLCGCLAGCSGSARATAEFHDDVPPPEEPLVTNVAGPASYGGRFVIGHVTPATFNPVSAGNTSITHITDRMFVTLVRRDLGTEQHVPALATSWEASADSRSWTFHLRHGAKFSDGHPITADDVLFTFELQYDPVLHPPRQDQLKMDGKPWTLIAPDQYTVVITTPRPNAIVPSLIERVVIVPRHVLDAPFRKGTLESSYGLNTPPDSLVSSGAWRLSRYVPGEKIVLRRNPYWFGVDQRGHRQPYLDELVYLILADAEAETLKFRTGEIDGIEGVPARDYAWYQEHGQSGDFRLFELGPAAQTSYMWFNLNRVRAPRPGKTVGEPYVGAVKYAWFNNPVFRRAVSMAVDRDAMIASVLFGRGQKSWSLIGPGNRTWFTRDLRHDDHDAAEARRLLDGLELRDRDGDGVREDRSGHPVRFTLKVSSFGELRVMATFIKDDLARVGIAAALLPLDGNTLIANYQRDFDYDAVIGSRIGGIDPASSLTLRSSSLQHMWNVKQPKPDTPEEARIDALMDVLVSEPDLAARQKAWAEIQTIVNEQGWITWLPTPMADVAVRSRFGNVQPTLQIPRLLSTIDRVYRLPAGSGT